MRIKISVTLPTLIIRDPQYYLYYLIVTTTPPLPTSPLAATCDTQPLRGSSMGVSFQPWACGRGDACAMPPTCRGSEGAQAERGPSTDHDARAAQCESSWAALSSHPRPHKSSISVTPWKGSGSGIGGVVDICRFLNNKLSRNIDTRACTHQAIEG